MTTDDRAASARTACRGLTGEALERHLFLCADCRAEVRLAAVWDFLRKEPVDAAAPPATPRFVASVRDAVRRDAARMRRRRLLLAAAAVLLFFFAAGANSRPSPAPSNGEEAYAGLAVPSTVLEDLLPE